MQITDSIGDMLTRIRNANSAKHETVSVPASNMKKAIAQILVDEGYIKSFKVVEDGKQGIIEMDLKYGPNKSSIITGIRRVSKPGLRIYTNCEDMPKVRKGLGIAYKHPLYVIGFNGERNEVIVGPNERLFTNRMICKFYNFLDDTIHKELKAEGKIRYAANPSPCTARILDDDTMEVIFEEPQRAITPGQSVAFYNGTQLLGGAVIDRVC